MIDFLYPCINFREMIIKSVSCGTPSIFLNVFFDERNEKRFDGELLQVPLLVVYVLTVIFSDSLVVLCTAIILLN